MMFSRKLKARCLSGFIKNKSGVAGVEFALLAPFMVMVVLTMAEVGFMSFDKMRLTAGVRTASQYVLTGGKNETVIANLITTGSSISAADLTISITKYCDCAVDGVAATCNASCGDGDLTRIYREISAQTVSGRLFRDWILLSAVEVRTR